MPFKDVTDPTDRLRAPGAPGEFKSPLETLNKAGDLIGPTYWMNEIIAASTGFNPLDKSEEYFAGDWEAYA